MYCTRVGIIFLKYYFPQEHHLKNELLNQYIKIYRLIIYNNRMNGTRISEIQVKQEDDVVSAKVVHKNNTESYSGSVDSSETDPMSKGTKDDSSPCEQSNHLEDYTVAQADYSKANSIPFRDLVQRWEKVLHSKSKKNVPSKEEQLAYLIPSTLKTYFNGGSIYPMLRLMCPNSDSARSKFWVTAKTIGPLWAESIGLSKSNRDSKRLHHFNDPTVNPAPALGDISQTIYNIMDQRYPDFKQMPGKSATVGEINQLLDEFFAIRQGHSFVYQGQQHDEDETTSKKKGAKQLRIEWIQKLIGRRFTPAEYKWIVRILIRETKLGIGEDSIISYIHVYAQDIYASDRDLARLCAKLCDPEYIHRKKVEYETLKQMEGQATRNLHRPKNKEPARIDSTLHPMLSWKTSFETALDDIARRHWRFIQSLDKNDPLRSSLALKFPAFTCENKLDGERNIVHVQNGHVSIHTRNGKWYSQHYSPVIGPCIRKALGRWDVDVILDGEVIAWDNRTKTTVPFGDNRSIAKARRIYLDRIGGLDERDLNCHLNDIERNVYTIGNDDIATGKSKYDADDGEHVWLRFIIFDILYLSGKDAAFVLENACRHLSEIPQTRSGSLIDFDLMHRKKLLYTLVIPEPEKVEIVETFVIRSDGTMIDGDSYFQSAEKEFGHSPLILDSISATLDGAIKDMTVVDEKRRKGKSDKEINICRAQALDNLYANLITHRKQEGLVIKDLSSPYGFGHKFRSNGYWLKLKDSYSKSGPASDIDCVVVGGSLAEGRMNSGLLNSFLLACIDSDTSDGIKYMTLATLNGNAFRSQDLKMILALTGYTFDEKTGMNKTLNWFKSDSIPDFISKRSFQRSLHNSDFEGWKPKSILRPTYWINPMDSFVVTISADSIVSSTDFSSGLSLRFPVLKKIRSDGFSDHKSPLDVDNVDDLREIYFEERTQAQEAERETQGLQNSAFESVSAAKFSPASIDSKPKKATAKRKRDDSYAQRLRAPAIFSTNQCLGDFFKGKAFVINEGTYHLDPTSLDAQEAKELGWWSIARKVREQNDVVQFVLKNGGICHVAVNENTDFIVGGCHNDPHVQNLRRALHYEPEDKVLKNGKKKSSQALRKMHEIGGVIKWTCLYSFVNQCSLNLDSDLPNFAPSRHDFLVLSSIRITSILNNEDKFGMKMFQDSSMIDLKRSILEVQKSSTRGGHDSDENITRKCILGSNSAAPQLKTDTSDVVDLDENERVSYIYLLAPGCYTRFLIEIILFV